jgi:hypothetical protein
MTPQQTQGKTVQSSELSWFAISVGGLFWYLLVLIIAFFTSRTFSHLLHTLWGLLFAIPPVAALLIGLMPPARNALQKATITTRAAVFILVTLPVLFLIVGAIFFLVHEAETRAKLLRVAFLIVVCILPAMMWFLFIVTRKASLLNGFLANLDRLGLLDLQVERGQTETEGSRQRRIESCLQRFEATYGTLPEDLHSEVLSGDFTYYSRADTAGTLSTATLPVALFTVLVAIGWLITLPPNELGSSNASAWIRAFEPVANPVTLAFLGAYFFSVQMLFRRYVLKDLGGAPYVAASIRIVLAVIGIWLVAAVGPIGGSDGQAQQKQLLSWQNQLLLYGFVFGVFPRLGKSFNRFSCEWQDLRSPA